MYFIIITCFFCVCVLHVLCDFFLYFLRIFLRRIVKSKVSPAQENQLLEGLLVG